MPAPSGAHRTRQRRPALLAPSPAALPRVLWLALYVALWPAPTEAAIPRAPGGTTVTVADPAGQGTASASGIRPATTNGPALVAQNTTARADAAENAAGNRADAGAGTPADAARAADIVRRADAVRFPEDSFQVLVKVESVSAGKTLEPRVYRIFSKGSENTIVQTLEPATERGQNMLMRGRDLWIFLPSVSQPVRLSLSQRLTGQVANGDLARANFAGDYAATLIGSETINGAEHHVLELVAAQRGVTYPKVVYRVRKSDHRPYDAQFYSVSGRLLKTCAWEEFGRLGDRVRPTKLVMTDALKPDDVSVMRYSELQRVKIPDRYFTKEFMKRLE